METTLENLSPAAIAKLHETAVQRLMDYAAAVGTLTAATQSAINTLESLVEAGAMPKFAQDAAREEIDFLRESLARAESQYRA